MPTDDTPPSPDDTSRPHGLDPGELLAAGLRDDGAPDTAAMAEHFPQLDLIEVIGEGGMGIVYRARQRSLDREVALKVLTPPPGDPLAFAERFQREARALAKLEHPHIVRIYDHGTTDGLHYLIMELVDGVNLRQAMQDGGLTPAQALRIVPQVCDALQFAHERGVVHRDIKPENVLLGKDGSVKIADFGLARMMADEVDTRLTRRDQIMGTLHYMAPEQIESPDDVDHRADIYSLGVVLYEMLTGELPIGRFDPPSERVQVDVRLDKVVLRALAKQRDRRYQAAAEFKTDVEGGVEGGVDGAEVPAPAPTSLEVQPDVPVDPPISTLAWLGLASFAFALAIVAATATLLAFTDGPLHPETYIEAWGLGGFLATSAGVVAVAFGVIAALKIRESNGRVRGHRLAMTCVIAPFFVALVIGIAVGLAAPERPDRTRHAQDWGGVFAEIEGFERLDAPSRQALAEQTPALLEAAYAHVHAVAAGEPGKDLGELYHPADAATLRVMPKVERRRRGFAGDLGFPMLHPSLGAVPIGRLQLPALRVDVKSGGRSAIVTIRCAEGVIEIPLRRGDDWTPETRAEDDLSTWRFALEPVRQTAHQTEGVYVRNAARAGRPTLSVDTVKRLHDAAVSHVLSGQSVRAIGGLYPPSEARRLTEMQSDKLDELRAAGRLGFALVAPEFLPEPIAAYGRVWSIDHAAESTVVVEAHGERSAIRYHIEVATLPSATMQEPSESRPIAGWIEGTTWYLSARPVEILDFTR